MTNVIGLGAGGHSKVIIDILETSSSYTIYGLLDPDKNKHGTYICGIPVLGDDSLLDNLIDTGIEHAFIGIGSSGNPNIRISLYNLVLGKGYSIISAIHSTATISKFSEIGQGTSIMAAAIINPNSYIGENVIINTGAIIEHDCVIQSHTHIATGAKLAGNVRVGSGSHIGAGAVIRQNIRIGSNSIVGAGAVVINHVPDNTTVVGVPAKPLYA